MKTDLTELRAHVAELSDEALLEVRPDELQESARAVYEEELASRNLSWNSTQTSEEAGADQEDLVPVAKFESVDEARFARTMLENEGVPVWFVGELTPTRMTADSLAGLELVTKPEFLEQAQAILTSEISEEELARQAEEAGPSEEDLMEQEEGEEAGEEEEASS